MVITIAIAIAIGLSARGPRMMMEVRDVRAKAMVRVNVHAKGIEETRREQRANEGVGESLHWGQALARVIR